MGRMNSNAALYEDNVYYNRDMGPYQSLSLPWWVKTPERTYPVRHGCRIEPLVCGERVFGQIARDLESAKSSVDIITWGFDPGMVLVRGKTARDGVRYGDLLKKIASDPSHPVKVRLVIWHDSIMTHFAVGNMPGYYGSWTTHFVASISHYYSEEHQAYNVDWFKSVLSGNAPNIELRVREIPVSLLSQSLNDESPPRAASALGSMLFATHHQKMVLIDYERRQAAIGYVMGHNSITDYWDTKQHKFQDARRERFYKKNPTEAWNQGPDLGTTSGGTYTPTEYEQQQKERAVQSFLDRNSFVAMPYQDVSCRVCGPILYDLNHNFCQAWRESREQMSLATEALWAATRNSVADVFLRITQAVGDHIEPRASEAFIRQRQQIPFKAFASEQFQHSMQLLRTQPQHKEKTIKECYANLTRLTYHYMFIQNQYVQYKDWVEYLFDCISEKRLLGYKAPLYLFILTSTPERAGMDVPTYEVAYRVGYSQAMPVIQALNQRNFEQGVKEKPLTPAELSLQGINVVMGSMWTCKEVPAGRKLMADEYEEIYIHAKVAIVDDSAFTIGSANLNLRSMAIDSELNVLSQAKDAAYQLRCELFEQCVGKRGPEQFESMSDAYQDWRKTARENRRYKELGLPLKGSLVEFHVDRQPARPLV
ncbi:hypothetical protein GCM10027277_32750 [Pseudoduganella ginsengisoli]|uniref:Phospholipase n=1 Tax=Pseudoduganella ginsengisoli TaxID=1462440 RepID=A0A6L6Q7P6_9BURK|nr:phospholipase D-like domain-containing protein [Pseudoduganella ginsengisoli]MTW05615.1 phospholipase [Pseudoduganella ginsengisoli]